MSSATLPIARRELHCSAIEFGPRRLWTVKDPVALRYFQLRDEEHFILRLLDGDHTVEQIQQLFESRFAPRKLRTSELNSFIGVLYREGLVVSPAIGQGATLIARRRRLCFEQRLGRWSNVLAIRIAGINPNRWLEYAAPKLHWLFGRSAAVLGMLVALAALMIVTTNFSTLIDRLPRFHEFFGPGNIVWLALTLTVVKSLHELGHAFACKRLGGDCTEMGVMMLVFTPVLYTHVSDAWLMNRKWQRIAISAAGIVVEIQLAAIASLLWASTYPGLFNALCLNVMFVCSVGTLLINGNPLLRYDGYYILADLLSIPNLSQQASTAFRRWIARLLAGVRIESDSTSTVYHQGWLIAYAIASFGYRIFALAGMLWLVHAALAPYGLAIVAYGMGLLTLIAIAIGPLRRIGRFFQDPPHRAGLIPGRMALSGIGLLLAIGLVILIPMPYSITAPVVFRPRDLRRIYVPHSGILRSAARSGQQVVAGQELARLQNNELDLEVAKLAARELQQRAYIHQLKIRQHDVPTLTDELPFAEQALQEICEQLTHQRQELQRLVLLSPIDGTILPPRKRPVVFDQSVLTEYAGTPLDEENIGCRLDAGALFCLIGDPSRLEAIAMIEESHVPLLAAGQAARLQCAKMHGSISAGRVGMIAQVHEDDLPPELVESQSLSMTQGSDRRMRPLRAVYQAVIELNTDDPRLLPDSSGWTKIQVAPQSLAQRVYRSLRETFRLPW